MQDSDVQAMQASVCSTLHTKYPTPSHHAFSILQPSKKKRKKSLLKPEAACMKGTTPAWKAIGLTKKPPKLN